MTVIETWGLTKSYGANRVLDGVDLSVQAGEVFALLGPNGAGKTTTVRILATLTPYDRGEARVAGYDVTAQRHEVRRRISLTGQYAALDELQTGAENLRMMARLRGLSARAARTRAAELLEQFALVDSADRRVGTYSGGMRRRLDLAAGLVVQPEVIFLDEPTTGLDPRSRQALWDVVAEQAAAGVTIFLTTQYLDEAERLADRIAVVDHGHIVALGTAAELKQRVAGERLDLQLVDDATFEVVLRDLGQRAVHVDRPARTIGVPSDGASQARALLDEIDPTGSRIERFTVHTASLDDVFLELTGNATTPEKESTHV
jgi:ABC-2 type transport system ATP-binding protein